MKIKYYYISGGYEMKRNQTVSRSQNQNSNAFLLENKELQRAFCDLPVSAITVRGSTDNLTSWIHDAIIKPRGIEGFITVGTRIATISGTNILESYLILEADSPDVNKYTRSEKDDRNVLDRRLSGNFGKKVNFSQRLLEALTPMLEPKKKASFIKEGKDRYCAIPLNTLAVVSLMLASDGNRHSVYINNITPVDLKKEGRKFITFDVMKVVNTRKSGKTGVSGSQKIQNILKNLR